MITEKQVRLAARMYEMRDTAKSLSRNYPEEIKTWIRLLLAASKTHNCEPIAAVPRIQAHLQERGRTLNDGAILWLTAAAVEVAEGNEQGVRA